MARYYFNIFDGDDIFDTIGTVLKDTNEARRHMLTLAKAWIELEAHRDAHWALEARDENENIVGSMRFGRLLDNGSK